MENLTNEKNKNYFIINNILFGHKENAHKQSKNHASNFKKIIK